LSITSALVLAHLGSTAVLLVVLGLVIVVQSVGDAAARRRARVQRRTAAAPSAVRFPGADRRRPVHSAG
jgi:Na+-transporting methylmalonyl-CoA/oxaloacetate decarboxylase gamma subunit